MGEVWVRAKGKRYSNQSDRIVTFLRQHPDLFRTSPAVVSTRVCATLTPLGKQATENMPVVVDFAPDRIRVLAGVEELGTLSGADADEARRVADGRQQLAAFVQGHDDVLGTLQILLYRRETVR